MPTEIFLVNTVLGMSKHFSWNHTPHVVHTPPVLKFICIPSHTFHNILFVLQELSLDVSLPMSFYCAYDVVRITCQLHNNICKSFFVTYMPTKCFYGGGCLVQFLSLLSMLMCIKLLSMAS